jgi:threonine dehydrogenase-like Zn-dependent dehydrogenase
VCTNKRDPARFITHYFKHGDILGAYEIFGHPADTEALKVLTET